MGRHYPSRELCLAVLLLLLQGVLAGHALVQHNPTVDETGHLLSGLLAWERGDLTFYNVNPPLVKMLQALPLLTLDWELPSHPTSHVPHFNDWVEKWNAFLVVNHERFFPSVHSARFANVLLSLACGWIIYRWSQHLFGKAASLIALSLWVFSPTILAWSGVCTVDLGAAFFALAAMTVLRSYLRQPHLAKAVWAGSILGLAQLAKFSLLILYPVTIILWVAAWLLDHRMNEAMHRFRWRHLAILFFTSLLVINLGYGFRGTGRKLGDYLFKCHALSGARRGWGNRFYGTWLAKLPIPLPASFVTGLDEQKSHEDRGFPAYLRGKWQHGGWWYYYLYALGVKLSIGTLALISLSALLFCGEARYRCDPIDELLLWLPALAILLLISSQTGINAHPRYLLPMFPFLFIGISRIGLVLANLEIRMKQRRWGIPMAIAALVFAALAWNVRAVIRIHPHYISYFNEFAGGPDNGWCHLLESNIDWGQDLLFLKRWVEEHPEACPLKLAYYGGFDPHLAGIDYEAVPGGASLGEDGPQPGWYAISVNLVGGAEWRFYDKRGQSIHFPPSAYIYFQQLSPVAKAGYSIFIYHVTAEDAKQARARHERP